MRQVIQLFALLGFLSIGVRAEGQQWGVTLHLNELYPLGNELKGYYPALWYSSTEGRGILLGGFGAGAYWQAPVRNLGRLRVQGVISRTRYYDTPAIFADANGQLLGAYLGTATQLNTTLLGLLEVDLLSWMHVASGAGLFGTPWAVTNYGDALVNGQKTSLLLRDRSRAPLVVILPLEISFSLGGRWRIRERVEWSITPVSRRADHPNERFLINHLEASYTFGKGRTP